MHEATVLQTASTPRWLTGETRNSSTPARQAQMWYGSLVIYLSASESRTRMLRVTIEIEDSVLGQEVVVVRRAEHYSAKTIDGACADAAMQAKRAMGLAGDHWPAYNPDPHARV